MLFDTDVLIWFERGNDQAARVISDARERFVSIQTVMELFQGARTRGQLRLLQDFIASAGFTVLPLTQNIGSKALAYVEEYALSHGMRAGDAIIAATAVENNFTLLSGNVKHFVCIHGLRFKAFRA